MEDKAEKKPVKKPYEKPRLLKYGKVEDVTKGNTGAVADITVAGSR